MPNFEHHKYIAQDTLSYPLEEKSYSNEWCGVYVDGTSKLTFDAANPAFHAFRVFSAARYPIFLFVSNKNDKSEIEKLKAKYSSLITKEIAPLTKPEYYNEWMFNQCFKLVPEKYEKIHTMQDDGYLIKSGYESYFEDNKFSYVGAPWDKDQQAMGSLNFPTVRVGNGGTSLRLRSKMIECINFINKHGGQHNVFRGQKVNGITQHYSPYLPEDLMFVSAGFGFCDFTPVTYEQARKFSHEPIESEVYKDKNNQSRPWGWHKCDK